jgi:hypothetical protein
MCRKPLKTTFPNASSAARGGDKTINMRKKWKGNVWVYPHLRDLRMLSVIAFLLEHRTYPFVYVCVLPENRDMLLSNSPSCPLSLLSIPFPFDHFSYIMRSQATIQGNRKYTYQLCSTYQLAWRSSWGSIEQEMLPRQPAKQKVTNPQTQRSKIQA